MHSGSANWASSRSLPVVLVALLASLLTACGHQNAGEQARLHLHEAMTLMEQRELPSAMEQLKAAENLLPQAGDDRLAAQVLLRIAWLNAYGGAHDLALIYYDFALPHAERSADKGLLIDVLLGKAHAQRELGETEHAWQTNCQARLLRAHANSSQRSSICTNEAFHQLLHDSLEAARQSAEEALMLASDTASLGNAFALLSYIYEQQGQTDRLEKLLRKYNDSPNGQVNYHRLRLQYEYYKQRGDYRQALEAYTMMQQVEALMEGSKEQMSLMRVQEKFDREMNNREKAVQRLWYSLIIIVLLNVVLAMWWWFGRKQRRQFRQYQQEIARMRDEMGEKWRQISFLAQKEQPEVATLLSHSVADTKAGIDVLYNLVAGNNVSQYGKKEERAVEQVLWLVNEPLARLIDDCQAALTPKETFFCIMEHYGKDDHEKAAAFCCSEQAVRSTKSRLGKKFDIGRLRMPDHEQQEHQTNKTATDK